VSIRSCLIALCVVCIAAWVIAQEALPGGAPGADPLAAIPPTGPEHYSYAIGLQIGSSFHDDQMEIDADSLLAGLKDGVAGAKPKYDQQLLAVAVQRMYKQQAENARKRNETYLVDNAKAEGVVVLPSGLQYKVLATGKGPSPKATDTVRVNYVGRFIDGSVFDESGDQPAEFRVDGVIAGWTEALQKMKVGDKWQLVVPSKLGYPQGRDEIAPGTTLVFEVELLGIVPAK
jgi:FKBP-type peptidyl-prolyl cis-trans isomerase